MTIKQKCKKCNDTKLYAYDENHVTICDACCAHSEGCWKLEKHYGKNNGRYACKTGCGTIIDKISQI